MVDVGTLSLILLGGMFVLLAIGMPLGFASAFLAVVALVLKFGPDLMFMDFGRAIFCAGTGRLPTNDQLRPDIGAVIYFYGGVAGTFRHCARYVFLAQCLAEPDTWRYRDCDLYHGGDYGSDVGDHWR